AVDVLDPGREPEGAADAVRRDERARAGHLDVTRQPAGVGEDKRRALAEDDARAAAARQRRLSLEDALLDGNDREGDTGEPDAAAGDETRARPGRGDRRAAAGDHEPAARAERGERVREGEGVERLRPAAEVHREAAGEREARVLVELLVAEPNEPAGGR